jgi:hypothetical protein
MGYEAYDIAVCYITISSTHDISLVAEQKTDLHSAKLICKNEKTLFQFPNSLSEDTMKKWKSLVSLVCLRQPPRVLPEDQRFSCLRNGGQEIIINNKGSN